MKKKNNDPAFLFYPEKFLIGIAFMTNEEVGMYIKLLCHQHTHGHLSDRMIDRICGGWCDFITEKFVQDSDGLWYNEVLDKEILRRKRYSEEQSKRVSKRYATVPTVVPTVVPTESLPPDKTTTITRTVTDNLSQSKKEITKQTLEQLYEDL